MNAPVLMAQLSGSPQASISPKNLKILKPQSGQSIAIHLDGKTKLDLSDIASEKLTFVRIGERLIILFDNQSTVTVDPVFDSLNRPIDDVTFGVSPDRILSGEEFASVFPLTTDQSVLPAAGTPGAPAIPAGANFGNAFIDPLATPNPLALLGPEELPTWRSEPRENGTPDYLPLQIAGARVLAFVEEEELRQLTEGSTAGRGNEDSSDPGVPNPDVSGDYSRVNLIAKGSLASLVGGGNPPLGFAVFAGADGAAVLDDSGNVLRSLGSAVRFDVTSASTVEGRSEDNRLIFTLTIESDGSFTFELNDQIDHPTLNGQIEGNLENLLGINLTGLIQVSDANGSVLVLSGDAFVLNVSDDIPVTLESATVVVDEDDLQHGNHDTQPGDDNPPGDAPQSAEAHGQLNFSLGSDAYPASEVPPQIVSFAGMNGQVVTGQFELGGNGPVTSQGRTLYYVWDAASSTLYGTWDQSDPSANAAFKLTITNQLTGKFTFTLLEQVDHGTLLPPPPPSEPTFGDSTVFETNDGPIQGPAYEDNVNLNLTYTVTDFDGDSVSGQVTIAIDDDVPAQTSAKVTASVFENDLDNYQPIAHDFGAPIEGSTGTSPGDTTTPQGASAVSGTLATLVSFGADGAAPDGGFSFAFGSNAAASAAVAALGLLSKGEAIDSAKLVGDWLTAGTGDRLVFALKLESNGSFRFVLFDQLDHAGHDNPATQAVETSFADIRDIDFSSFVRATDYDGDSLVIDAGSFVVRVTDDVPEVVGQEHRTANENDLANFNPAYPVLFDFWQGSIGTSPHDGASDGSITGLFGTVPVWGTLADNIKGGADERGHFQLVSETTAEALLGTIGPNGGVLKSHGDVVNDARQVHIDGIGDVMGFFASDGRLVFGLYVSENGTYNFRLFDQLDHLDGSTKLDSLDLDLSKLVTYTDRDGDTIDLGNGTFVVTVTDDAPVVIGQEHHTVNENDLANFNPLYPAVFDFWQGSLGTSPYDGHTDDSITGLLGTVPVWGTLADNIKGGADERGEFHLVSESTAETLLAKIGPNGGVLKSHGDVVNDARMITIEGLGDLMGFFASDGRLVLGLYLNETGVYNFRLFDQIDHPIGDNPNTLAPEAVADRIDLDLSHFVTYTDFDGDTVDMGNGTFVIGVTDDIPEVVGSISVTLDEDDLHNYIPLLGSDVLGSIPELLKLIPSLSNLIIWQGSNGTSPDADTDILIGTTSQQGLLNEIIGNNVVNGGADEFGHFGLVSEARAEQLLGSLNWTSKGDKIDDIRALSLDGVGTVMGFFADGRLVFSLSVAEIGAYDLRLFDQLDHTYGDNQQGTLQLDLSKFVTYTDFDGDKIDLGTGNFVLNVIDDVPVLTGATLSATVEEEQLWPAGDMLHGNEDGNSVDGLDGDNAGNLNAAVLNVAILSLDGLVNGGADENGTFGFASAVAGQPVKNAAGQVLSSHGVAMAYAINGGKLIGFADSDGDGKFDSGERTVFTVSLTEINLLNTANKETLTFTLLDQIDHPAPTPAGTATEDVVAVDLSAAINYTDADGDTVALTPNTLTVKVIDDTPVQTGLTVSGVVEEEQLPGGNEDVSSGETPDADEDFELFGFSVFDMTTETATGNLRSLVRVGADEVSGDGLLSKGTFSLAAPANGLPVLTSKGEAVSYTVLDGSSSDKLLAYVDGNHNNQFDAGERQIFTFEVKSGGDYKFTLLDQIDHSATSGQNIENVAALDLSAAVRFSDYDGDTIGLSNGTVTFKVIDDTPIAELKPGTALVLDETVAGSASDNGGNNGDEAGHTDPFGYGTLIGYNTGTPFTDNSKMGADEGGSKLFELVLKNTATGLVDAVTDQPITLSAVNGTIVGKTTGGAVVFAVGIDSATGKVTVAQYRAIEHNDPNDADESGASAASIASGAVQVKLTLTDADGDTTSASTDLGSQIRFEDDGAVITAVETKGVAMNLPDAQTVTGDIAVSYGSDGYGSLKISGVPTIPGITTSLSEDGHTVIGRLSDNSKLYTLTIDPTQGSDGYTFTLHQPWPATPKTFTVASNAFVEGGSGNYSYAGGAVTFQGINPYNGGFGVSTKSDWFYDDNEIEHSEHFSAHFATAMDKVTFNLDVRADYVSDGTVTVKWTAWNGTDTQTGTVIYSSNGIKTLDINPSIAFSDLKIEVTTSGAAGLRDIQVTGFSGTTVPQPAGDQDLNFQITATDGDGDRAVHSLTVHLDQAPVVSVQNVTVEEAGLPARGGQTSGSAEAADGNQTDNDVTTESKTGTITIVSSDGLGEVRFTNEANASTTVTLAQLTGAGTTPVTVFDDATGKLEITGYNAGTGVVSYRYTLEDNVDHGVAGAADQQFKVVAVDPEGYASAPATLIVSITDDVPTLDITGQTSVPENYTASGHWTIPISADGVTSVAVTVGATTQALSLASAGDQVQFPVDGSLLTVKADGSWTLKAGYNYDSDTAPVESVSFTIKATDVDGSPASDSQTITITDGDDISASGTIALQLSEADLDTVKDPSDLAAGNTTGNNAAGRGESDRDTGIVFTAGSDDISVAFATPSGDNVPTVSGLQSGYSISWAMSGNQLVGTLFYGSQNLGTGVVLALTAGTNAAAFQNVSPEVTATLVGALQHTGSSVSIGNIVLVASDHDGDSRTATASITISDDVPQAEVSATLTASVDEDGLSGANVDAGRPGEVSSPPLSASVTGAAGALTALFDFGADGQGTTPISLANITTPVATGLTSGGSPVVVATSGGVLYGYVETTGGTGYNAGDRVVFTLTVGSNGSYEFTLKDQIDHPTLNGGADDDTENTLSSRLDLSKYVIATDRDGDATSLSAGTFLIDVRDDIPVIEKGADSLIKNGSFEALGNAQVSNGQWEIYDSIPGWSKGDNVPFEVQVGDIGRLKPQDGNVKIELDGDRSGNSSVPGGAAPDPVHSHATIEQTVTTAVGQNYELNFYYAARPDAGAGSSGLEVLWNGQVVYSIDPDTSTDWQQISLAVTANSTSSVLAFRAAGPANEENTLGAYIDNVKLTAVATVDEDGLASGARDSQPGDANVDDTDGDHNEATATGSLKIKWGADALDNPDTANDKTSFVQDNFGRSLTFSNASVAVGGVAVLSSHGEVVNQFVLSNNNSILTAKTASDREVFQVLLSDDGSGAFRFVLLDHLDHAPGQAENDLLLSFNYTATDSDGDAVSGRFSVAVDDDMPVAANDSESQSAENQAFTIAVFGNDVFGADGVDTDNSPAAKVTFTQPEQGVVTYDGTTRLFTYTPSSTAGSSTTDWFTYTIEDGDGDQSTATVSLTLKPDSVPTVSVTDGTVDESGLSNGSASAGSSETTTGSFTIATGHDTLGSLKVKNADGVWVDVTSATIDSPLTVRGANGVLTVTSDGAGRYSWSYTLTQNLLTHDATVVGAADQKLGEAFSVRATDNEGDVSATATLTITVNDDGPKVDFGGKTSVDEGGAAVDGTYQFLAGADGTQSGQLSILVDGGTAISRTAAQLADGESIDTGVGLLVLSAPGAGGIGTWTFKPATSVTADRNVSISITLTDGDGDVDTDTHQITVKNVSNPLSAQPFSGVVEEEQLQPSQAGRYPVTASGNEDTDDATDRDTDNTPAVLATATGSFGVTGGDGSYTYAFNVADRTTVTQVGGGAVKSHGADVRYHNVDADTVIGYVDGGANNGYGAGDRVVFSLDLTTGGNYTFTLYDNIDHPKPTNGGPQTEETIEIDFGNVVVANDGFEAPLNLQGSIAVIDDTPVVTDSTALAVAGVKPSVNVVLVIDTSSSMGSGSTSGTPMYLAKQAAVNLLMNSDVTFNQVMVVDFASTASGTGWTDKNAAINYINDLTGAGGTNYDAALNKVMTSWGTGPSNATQTLVYFISDGEPTLSMSNPGFNNPGGDYNASLGDGIGEETANNNNPASDKEISRSEWEYFLGAKGVTTAYGIGVGSGVTASNLEPISWTATDPGLDPVIISSASELQVLLTGSLPGNPNGNVFSTHGGSGGVGADDGYVRSIAYNGATYTYDGSNPAVSIADGRGGKLVFNFVDNGLNHAGDWDYYSPANSAATDAQLKFDFVVVDGDGDTAAGRLVIDLKSAPTIAVGDVSVAENGDYAVFNVSLSHPTLITVPVTFAVGGGTATAGVDYGTTTEWSLDGSNWSSAPFNFAPSQTSVQVRVKILNDTLFENPDETFNLTATAATGTLNGSDTGVATILNDGDVNSPPIVNDDAIVKIVEAAHTNDDLGFGAGPTAGVPTVAAVNVLTNDVDPGDPLRVTQVRPQGGAATDVPNGSSVIVQGLYGELTIHSNGITTYKLDNTLAATQALKGGEAVQDVFSYTAADSGGMTSAANITVSVTGANDAPVIWAPDDFDYLSNSTTATPLNMIKFADVDTVGPVTVTFKTGDLDGSFYAASGGGVTVTGSETAKTLTGTIEAINAFIANGRLTYEMDGWEDDKITVSINDGNGGTDTTTFSVDRIKAGSSDIDYMSKGIFNIHDTNLDFGKGNDTVVSAVNHVNVAATTYLGGASEDTIRTVFTADQLNEVLNSSFTKLREFFDGTPNSGLDLDSSSWNAKVATDWEVAQLGIAAPRDLNGADNYYELDTWTSVIGLGNVAAANTTANATRNGTNGKDVIIGGASGQTLNGGDNSDVLVAFHTAANTLNGGNGADLLLGGDGSDVLNGGAGLDYLAGGKGADKFSTDALGAGNRDVILDYSFTEGDTLDLSALLGNLVTPDKDISKFVQVSAGSSKDEANDLIVRVDTTGTGTFGTTQEVFLLAGANTNSADPIKVLIDTAQQHILTG